jgi:hypothetical protein
MKSTRSGQIADGMQIYFNGDTTGSNYRRTTLYDEGGSIGGEDNYNGPQFGVAPAANASTNSWNGGTIYIPGYSGSGRKVMHTSNQFMSGGGVADRYMWDCYMNWSGTNPITTVRIQSANSANYAVGSSITVYGIKKA